MSIFLMFITAYALYGLKGMIILAVIVFVCKSHYAGKVNR